MRQFILLMALACAPALAAENTYYLDVVNTAPVSLRSFAVASAGSGRFVDMPLADHALHGGGDSATVALHGDAGDCLRDLRFTFADGRVMEHRNVNVCHRQRYRTGDVLRASRSPTLQVTQR